MLIQAAGEGDIAKIQRLMTDGANLKESAALAAAVRSNNFEAVQFLIENGADANGGNKTWKPVLEAANLSNETILKYLIYHGANLDAESPTDTSVISTPLINTVYYGKIDAARMLIANGADVNYVSRRGNTALNQALRHVGGDRADELPTEFVKLLLSNGANPDIPGESGFTSRQYAILTQRTELSELIESINPPQPGTVQISAADLRSTYLLLLNKEICEQKIPGFKEKAAPAYQVWQRKNASLVAQLLNSPGFKEQVAQAKGNTNLSSQSATIAMVKPNSSLEETCEDGVLGQLEEEQKIGLNPNLSTPELTWAYFLEALRNADTDKVLSCLVPPASFTFQEHFKNGSSEELRQRAESIISFELTGMRSGKIIQGMASGSDGWTGYVNFQNINGDWRISAIE